ncbi:uncharacterized protein LOC111945014, partial [Cyanistes caeruleus]|uniref:uncharacterized protein LOC111945014 n=1 Tax=Cyanistes caeruleus TaxID=156563 RepID=UPI000CDAEF2D
MRQMLKEMLQGGQEVDRAAVLKAAFPGGSSGPWAASAAGREAMPGTVTGDWNHNLHYPEALLDDSLKHLRNAGGVPAGRTFPAPGLVTVRKPGSHRRGPPSGKNKAAGHQKLHVPSKPMRQMLKEMLQGGQVPTTPRQKWIPAHHGRGSDLYWLLDWDQDMDYLEAQLDDSWQDLENAGAKPLGEGDLASQPTSRTEALGDGEGVPAARTFPAPGLVTVRKPSSHRRGPPSGKNKAAGHQKLHVPSKPMKQMLKEMLQGGQVPTTPRQKWIPAHHGRGSDLYWLLDWDQDMDYLEARLDDSWQDLENAGAKPLGEGDLASQPTSRTEALGDGEGVSAGRTFPAPGLVTVREPGSHRRGPPSGKNKAAGHQKLHVPSKITPQMLKEMLQGGQGGSMSLSLLLRLSSQGLSLHSRKRIHGSLAAPLLLSWPAGLFPSLAWLQLLPSLCRKAFGISRQGAQSAARVMLTLRSPAISWSPGRSERAAIWM